MKRRTGLFLLTIALMAGLMAAMTVTAGAEFVEEGDKLYVDMLDGQYDKGQLYQDCVDKWGTPVGGSVVKGYYYGSKTNQITGGASGDAELTHDQTYTVWRADKSSGRLNLGTQTEVGSFTARTYYHVTADVAADAPDGAAVTVDNGGKVYAGSAATLRVTLIDGYTVLVQDAEGDVVSTAEQEDGTLAYTPSSSIALTVVYVSAQETAAVELNVGEHGSVSGITEGTVPAGEYPVTATPDDGYYVASFKVNGDEQAMTYSSCVGSYTLNAEKDQTYAISVTFAKREIALKDAGDGYTVGMNGFYKASEQRDDLKAAILTSVVEDAPEDAIVEFYYPVSLFGQNWHEMNNEDVLNKAFNLDNLTTTVLVRITYPATDRYPAVSTDPQTISLKESRSTEFTANQAPYALPFRPNEPAAETAKNIYDLAISAPVYDEDAQIDVKYLVGILWEPLDYDGSLTHNFGGQETERIQIKYSSATTCFTYEFDLTIVDGRTATSIQLGNETVTVTYGSYTLNDLLTAAAPTVVDENGQPVPGAIVTSAQSADQVEAWDVGTYELTLKYDGDADYKPCTATVTVVVEKADCTVDIPNVTMTYTGQPADVPAVTDPAGITAIRFVAGLDVSEANMENGKLQGVVTKVALLHPAFESVSMQVKLTDLMSLLPMFGIPQETMDSLLSVLETLPGDVQNFEVTLGGGMPSDIGLYLTGAVTMDSNYNTAYDVGYLVISPVGCRATLDWVTPLDGGAVPLNAVQNGLDLSAQVTAVEEGGSIDEAAENLFTLFMGIGSNGKPVFTQDQAELTTGAYTELSCLLGWGNTVYSAAPIARAFTVTVENVDIRLVDETGAAVEHCAFPYDGQPQALRAIIVDSEGNDITENCPGTLTVTYSGITLSGESFHGTQAPDQAGFYTVTASYVELDGQSALVKAGIETASLTIFRAELPFALVDTQLVEDGQPHFVNMENPQNAAYISVVVDPVTGEGCLRLPEELSALADTLAERLGVTLPASVSVTELKDALSQLLDTAEEAAGQSELLEELNTLVETLPNVNLTINGEYPSTAGTYQAYAMAWTANYRPGFAQAVLTIQRPLVPVTGITLDKTTLRLSVGGTDTLTAVVAPENADNKAVLWTSSNENVAAVDESGRVTARAAGTAVITATTVDGSFSASCTVTVPSSGGGNSGSGSSGSGSSGNGNSTPVKEPAPVFVDVPSESFCYDAVQWAVQNNITTGTSATTFTPHAPCTRAEILTFLWRAAGSPAPKSSTMPFGDVSSDMYYYDAILWAAENGITLGSSDVTFSPDAACTRAQIVTFLWRSENAAASDVVNPFDDVAVNTYYTNAVNWAVEHGITVGTTSSTFSPNVDCTRAQSITFLYRNFGK